MSGRRGLLGALAACVLGAAVVLLAAGRPWVRTAAAPGLAAGLGFQLTGRSLARAVPALGLVALAGSVAVVATRGRLRSVVGGLLVVAGGWTWWLAVRVAADPGRAVRGGQSRAVRGLAGVAAATATGWPWAATVGGLLVALAGLLVAVRGAGWPGMSGRFDRSEPARRRAVPPEVALWDALDRGDDPT